MQLTKQQIKKANKLLDFLNHFGIEQQNGET